MTTDHRALPSSTLSLLVCAIALIGATVLGLAARGDNVLEWDVDIAVAVQGVGGAVVEALADAANALGSTPWAASIIALSIIVAAATRTWPELTFLFALLVLRLVGTQTKALFDSPRPTEDLVTILGTWDGMGYPSGHALTGSTMALGLAVIAWRRIPSRTLAVGAVALLIAVGLLIGWARIWTGAHWPSDVIGGYLFGIGIVAVSLPVLQWMDRREPGGGADPEP